MLAHRLVDQRTRRGFLTAADFAVGGNSLPPGTGFTSDLYWVRTRATIGDSSQQLTSLIARRRQTDGTMRVAAVERWLGARPPAQAPPLPF